MEGQQEAGLSGSPAPCDVSAEAEPIVGCVERGGATAGKEPMGGGGEGRGWEKGAGLKGWGCFYGGDLWGRAVGSVGQSCGIYGAGL